MISHVLQMDDDYGFEQEWHDNLCGIVLEELDELDAEGEALTDAVLLGPEAMVEFLLQNPKWAIVVRHLVRIKLHEFDAYVEE